MSAKAKLLAIGFVGLFVLAALLWHFTQRAMTAPSVDAPHVATERPVVSATVPVDAPPPLPLPADATPPNPLLPMRSNGPTIPVASLTAIRTANAGTDELVRACIAASNSKPTGKVVLTFLVVQKHDAGGDRVVVESSGFEEQGATLTDPALIDCLHKTAFAMKLAPSAGDHAVFAKRRVVIDHGVLAENWVFEGRMR